MKVLNILLTIIFIFTVVFINAQDTGDSAINSQRQSKGYSFRAFYQGGSVFPTNDFVKGNNPTGKPVDSYQAFSLQFGRQTYGKKIWQQIFGYPYIGVGLYKINFHRPEDLGSPIGFYAFLNGPIKRLKKLSINYHTSIGMMFGWGPYDAESNPYQIAIGATNSVKIDVGISLNYLLSKYFEVDAGFTLTHFSNGSMTMPNYGINMFGPRVGVKYNLLGQPDFIKTPIPKYESQLEWLIELKLAVKQITPDTSDIYRTNPYNGVDYGIFGISTTLNKQFSYTSKYGFGFDLVYDGSINAQLSEESDEDKVAGTSFYNSLAISIFPSYELVIHNLSLFIQPGIYIYKKKVGEKPNIFYQRLGFKYRLGKTLYAGVSIKANDFKVADCVEWVAGYRIFRNKI